MPFFRSPKLKLLTSLFKAPDVSLEQQADRLRFMERDVALTIKAIVLGALTYYFFFSDWFEGIRVLGETDIVTVRKALGAYLAANLVIGFIVLAMDFLPLALVRWSVFVINIVDGSFVALLIVMTGGLSAVTAAPTVSGQNLDLVLDVELPLIVRFGRTQMSFRALSSLGPGSLLDLGRTPDDPVEMLIGERVIARGEVVIVGGNYGLRVLDLISPAERARAMEV